MPVVIQAKGKKHIRNISNAALNMFRYSPVSLDFKEYIRIALEDHRQLVIENEIKKKTEDHECL